MKNKTKIRITAVASKFWYLESYLSPRYAHSVGDVEIVNNSVLGFLRRMKASGAINFEIINS